MEAALAISLSVAILVLLISFLRTRNVSNKNTPPGPKGWPLFGNMFDLGDLPHQTMARLGTKYGPVVWLRLGSVNTMVVQNAAAAAELFKKHDGRFCDRTVPDALTSIEFNQNSLSFNAYGGHWRTMRKLCSMEFLVNKKMNESSDLRRRIMDNMVRWIEEESADSIAKGGSGEVHLSRFLVLMTFNLVGNLMLSKDLMDPKDPKGSEFFECMNTILEMAGTPNVADFLPILKILDPMRMKRKMTEAMTRTMKITSKFVNDKIIEREAGNVNVKKDFVDSLLEYEGDGKDGPVTITNKNINVNIMEMFLAASETTSITIEWGFAELLCNPQELKKVKEEIDRVVGRDRKVEERDMDNLPYLQAVVKESLRLHPALPLLLPRKTMEDTNYMGYDVPKGTQVLVNAWAIGRDPESWKDPLVFKPERFLNSNIEYKGQNYEFIPFGSGRRICIGFPLAHRVVHLALATLAQSFDWELPNGLSAADMDMDESLGLSLRKKTPVKVILKRIQNHA